MKPTAYSLRNPRSANRNQSGVALVLVLAFIVLLTGLVVAYFSHSIDEAQLARSSTSNAKADQVAMGAVETILSDLKQEIAAGSNSTTAGSGTTAVTIFTPKAAMNMVPAIAMGTGTATGLENLVKCSAYKQKFYPATGYDGNGSDRASNVSTTGTSLNGRFVSPARWNTPLFLVKSNTSSDSDISPVKAFRAPDWVLVDRSGPIAPVSSLSTGLTWSPTNSTTVIGRYAYTIYDEGGLLDINAAGYSPTATAKAGVTGTAQMASKASLAYADLSQIPGIKDLPATGYGTTLSQVQMIDSIFGWRNFVSASTDWTTNPPMQSTAGTIAGYLATGTPGYSYALSTKSAAENLAISTNYFNYVLSNTTGYLTSAPGYTRTVGSSSRVASDHLMMSRQELIRFFLSGCASHTSTANAISERANLQNALPYFTHFSRDLNQPSYVPPASRPKVLPQNQGGNNAGGQNPPLDDQINPSFLTVRATKTFTRNDGSTAIVGEPLVKRRFALNRLAWLTCKGPSAPRATSSDADIAALKAAGFTTDWLQQGTDANILKYFGLQWTTASSGSIQSNYWKYMHGRSGSNGPIMKLSEVVNAGRDADFFELLKAAINVGSIGKVGSSVPSAGVRIPSLYNQYFYDYSVDNQIIQIGADIIDQFDSDNFPTRIVFDDGSNQPTAFAGIENLPYLYRVHPATVKVVTPKVDADTSGTSGIYYGTGTGTGGDTLNGTHTILDTGLGATILIPELWNPHDWCGDNATQAQLDQTMGTLGPYAAGAFQIYAESQVPVTLGAGNSWSAEGTDYAQTNPALSPGYEGRDGSFRFGGSQWGPLTAGNTGMLFTVSKDATGAQLFREPTVLYRKGFPTGSALSAPGLASAPGAVASGGELKPAVAGQDGSANTPGPPVIGRKYIGMYLGTIPLIWRKDYPQTPTTTGTTWRSKYADIMAAGVTVTFNLQCKDAFGNMVTYDQKAVTLGEDKYTLRAITAPMNQPWSGLLQSTYKGDRQCVVLDPRTSRFGVQSSGIDADDGTYTAAQWSFPPFSYNHLSFNRITTPPVVPVEMSWISRDEGIMGSLRNGWGNGAPVQALAITPPGPFESGGGLHSGLTPYNFPTSMGFYPGNAGNNTVWTWGDAQNACRLGLFAENDAAPLYNDNNARDVQWYYSRSTGMTYTQSQYYTDADGVARRGMGGWTDARTGFIGPPDLSAFASDYAALTGLPMRVAHTLGSDNKLHKTDIFMNYPPSGPTASLLQSEARPMILNRPFHSVAELGYTFSGTPWKNLNFSMPESGDAALLDVFCINDSDDSRALVAGKVNLNTRQLPVLKAILVGAYKNEWGFAASPTSAITSGTLADIQANRFLARTTGVVPSGVTVSGTGARPLQNLSELVGKWVSGKAAGVNPGAAGAPPYGPTSYDGYSADLLNPAYFLNMATKTPNTDATDDPTTPGAIPLDKTVTRRRDAAIRALENAGQTRLWNLMIDVVAQTGRYPQSASALDKFVVEGEQRYWVHVAIDRLTGEVVDKQIEIVKE